MGRIRSGEAELIKTMNENAAVLIQLEDISKVFLTDEVETHALSTINMEVRKGEFVAIAGPSGCGKSTLLSILGLLDSPSGGKYTLNGRASATARWGSFFKVLI